jgi:dihydrofolate reductase
MRKLTVSINLSLDGYADHTVAIADDELHDFSTQQMEGLDGVLFGRKTYQLFEDYWPHAAEEPRASSSVLAYAKGINAIPKVVFSNTLLEVSWNNSRLIKGNLLEEVAKLKAGDGRPFSVGGLHLIKALTERSLIDEYWLLIHPRLVGKGRRLFDDLNNRPALKLADTQTFHSGVAVLHYLLDNPSGLKE